MSANEQGAILSSCNQCGRDRAYIAHKIFPCISQSYTRLRKEGNATGARREVRMDSN